MAVTVLHEGRLHLRIDPRADGMLGLADTASLARAGRGQQTAGGLLWSYLDDGGDDNTTSDGCIPERRAIKDRRFLLARCDRLHNVRPDRRRSDRVIQKAPLRVRVRLSPSRAAGTSSVSHWSSYPTAPPALALLLSGRGRELRWRAVKPSAIRAIGHGDGGPPVYDPPAALSGSDATGIDDRFFVLCSIGPTRSSKVVSDANSNGPTNRWTESTPSGAFVQARLARELGDRLAPAVTFATTEHFTLQTARVATVAEANGRASIYLAALSSNLIALAFMGQMSRLGSAFYAFALILLPMLAFMGVVTFQRLVQSSLEDIAYAERIARMRAFYVGLAPELDPFLLVVQRPRAESLLHGAQLGPSAWQLMLTTAGMVGVVNSAVIGACAGLAIQTLAIRSFAVALIGGSITGVVTLVLHRRHHRRARDAYTPESVDQAAIVLPMAQDAEAA